MPRCVVRLLVEMLEPYRGRVYDSCCGSDGMLVQPMEFIRAHVTGNGNLPTPKFRQAGGGCARADISVYGQESNDLSNPGFRLSLFWGCFPLGLAPARDRLLPPGGGGGQFVHAATRCTPAGVRSFTAVGGRQCDARA